MFRTLRIALLLGSFVIASCTGTSGRSTTDSRVRDFMGQTASEMPSDGTWLGGTTSLAGLRGRTVYLQFAFPT